jgi:hypothetical protein
MRPMTSTLDVPVGTDELAPTQGEPRAAMSAPMSAPFVGGVPTMERLTNDGFQPAVPYPMGRSARRSLAALVVLLCPTVMVMESMQERITAQVRISMNYMPWIAAFGLRFCIELLDWSPRLMFRSIRRLRGMAPEKARALLHELSESSFTPIRTVMYGVKGIILNAYFDQQEVHRELNYAPAPFMVERIKLRQRMLAGEQPTAADHIPVYPGVNP